MEFPNSYTTIVQRAPCDLNVAVTARMEDDRLHINAVLSASNGRNVIQIDDIPLHISVQQIEYRKTRCKAYIDDEKLYELVPLEDIEQLDNMTNGAVTVWLNTFEYVYVRNI